MINIESTRNVGYSMKVKSQVAYKGVPDPICLLELLFFETVQV